MASFAAGQSLRGMVLWAVRDMLLQGLALLLTVMYDAAVYNVPAKKDLPVI